LSTLNLLDVELPVLIRFGSTTMLLRDILALNHGSVIPFHRPPDEPADIVVNGCVVARGAVVTVKGNYAVRVTEVGENL